MRTQPLTRYATCVLDEQGNGTASVGPSLTGETWTVGVAAVSVVTNTNEANCKTYAGVTVAPSSFVDGTTWGSTGDSTSNFVTPIWPGAQVFAVWTGGDPLATATLTLNGTRTVP